MLLKKSIDGDETEVQLLKKEAPFGKNRAFRLPTKILPNGLSLERQWYLYEQIRTHIPRKQEKDMTCPKPNQAKLKKHSP